MFPSPAPKSLTPAECPTFQFSSNIFSLDLASKATSKGSLQTPVKVQVITCTSDQLTVNQCSHSPFLGFNHLLEQLTEFRETFMFTSLLYSGGYDKGSQRRDTPGGVWEGLGAPPAPSWVQQPGSSLNSVLLGL